MGHSGRDLLRLSSSHFDQMLAFVGETRRTGVPYQPIGCAIEPSSQFGWLPSGKFHSDCFEALAQPSVSGIGGMAQMPIHRFVDVGEIEWRLH
jgi:hypothetical protein